MEEAKEPVEEVEVKLADFQEEKDVDEDDYRQCSSSEPDSEEEEKIDLIAFLGEEHELE